MPLSSIRYAILLVMVPVAALGAGNNFSLMDAVKSGNREAVRALLKQHADVNQRESDGMTALHWAVRANDGETTQLLIRAGANVKAVNRYEITPLSLAATNGNPALVELLLKAGADANDALSDGETVLMTAARTGNVPTLKLLLAYGADPNAKESTQGQTALMWTATENHAAAAQTLIEGRGRHGFDQLTKRRLDDRDVRGARKREGNCPRAGRCRRQPESDRSRGHDRSDRSDYQRSL